MFLPFHVTEEIKLEFPVQTYSQNINMLKKMFHMKLANILQ